MAECDQRMLRIGHVDNLGCVSALGSATYSGHRATAATGGGLRASAARPAGRGVLGSHWRVRGLRREPLSAARCEVSRETQPGDVPDLPKGTTHAGVVGIRRTSGCGIGLGAHRRRIGVVGNPLRRVRRPRGGGVPNMQLESLGQVVCARCGAPAEGHADGAQRRPYGH